MANDDDAGTILQKIGRAVRSVVELEVITVVGSFPISIDEDGRPRFTEGEVADAELLVTRIDLADGDIVSYVDPVFLSDEKKAVLREFHTEQVAAATAIMDRNVRVFTELAKAFGLRLDDVVRRADGERAGPAAVAEPADRPVARTGTDN